MPSMPCMDATAAAAPLTGSIPATGPSFPTGLVLAPFRGLRYDADVAGDLTQVTSPPYDVVDAAAVFALEAASDFNVVRLILPRDQAHPGDRYTAAALLLSAWREQGALRPDPEAALYVYEQRDPQTGHAQRGLLGALALSPAQDGIVLPHENTMGGPVADRLALYTAVGADLEPIFLIHSGPGAARDAVAGVDSAAPLVDLLLPDGLRHRLWALSDPGQLADVAADLLPRTATIADGHHRYATYLQRQADAHARGLGPGPWDVGLTFLVDAGAFGPQVHPIHRVVHGVEAFELARRSAGGATVHNLDGQDLEAALSALSAAGSSGAAFLLVSPDGGTLRLLTDLDPARRDAAMPTERSAAWRALDVSALHSYLIADLWHVDDDEESVGYAHSAGEAIVAAAASNGTAVLLNPTPVEGVSAVAALGERMPRKSTLFTPKPRSGLILRDHRDI